MERRIAAIFLDSAGISFSSLGSLFPYHVPGCHFVNTVCQSVLGASHRPPTLLGSESFQQLLSALSGVAYVSGEKRSQSVGKQVLQWYGTLPVFLKLLCTCMFAGLDAFLLTAEPKFRGTVNLLRCRKASFSI